MLIVSKLDHFMYSLHLPHLLGGLFFVCVSSLQLFLCFWNGLKLSNFAQCKWFATWKKEERRKHTTKFNRIRMAIFHLNPRNNVHLRFFFSMSFFSLSFHLFEPKWISTFPSGQTIFFKLFSSKTNFACAVDESSQSNRNSNII